MTPTCEFPPCDLPAIKRQWCNGHYRQWLRGKPFKPLRRTFDSVEDRFWAKVDKSAGPDACWLWTGALHSGDFPYGKFRVNTSNDGDGRTVTAHRLAVELTSGPIPDGMFVCHKCDNPRCCNPAHLFVGTPDDNVQDMTRKGRHYWQQRDACKRGHPFDAENTRWTPKGTRLCRTCARAAVNARNKRIRESRQ